jgi:vacuolar protein sorting-associated protein 45
VCQKLAESLAHLTGSEERELFDFGRRAGEAAPLMLILDRRDDPVTPLLQQWTFQVAIREPAA